MPIYSQQLHGQNRPPRHSPRPPARNHISPALSNVPVDNYTRSESRPGTEDYWDTTNHGLDTFDRTNKAAEQLRRAAALHRARALRISAGAGAGNTVGRGVGGTPGTGWAKFTHHTGKVLGPLGAIGGAVSTYQAGKDLLQAQTTEQAVDAGVRGVGALAGTTSGVAATGAAFSPLSSARALKLGRVAGVAGGVAALADGGLDIYQGYRDGDKGQMGRGGLKAIAGGMMIGGSMTGAAPVAVAGAVLYGGVVLYENREVIGKVAAEVGGAVVDGAKVVGGAVADSARAVGGAVVDGAEAVADGARAVGGAVADGARAVGGAVSDGARAIGSEVASWFQSSPSRGSSGRSRRRGRRSGSSGSSTTPRPSSSRARGSSGRSRSRGRRSR
jgi:hypothetical protein